MLGGSGFWDRDPGLETWWTSRGPAFVEDEV